MTSRRTLIGGALLDGSAKAAVKIDADPVAHLLRRATYGPTPAALAEAKKFGVAGWLDRQLDPARIDDTACDRLLARLPLAGASIAKVRASLPLHSYAAFGQLGRAAIARAVWSNRQLFETTAMFWANHLHISAPSSGVWDSRCDYETQVIRKYAFGKFSEMLKASARHPAMLTYLDNRSSTRAHPNENYARELMELHTVGLIYSEADVAAAARLLVGLGTEGLGTDTARKDTVKILGFTGNDPDSFFAYLTHHPATAQRIATKLCVRFVADDAPASLVAKLAKVYLDNDTAITPVLRALFTSPEFAASAGQKMRTPLEDVAASIRALGLGPERDGIKALDALYNELVDAGNAPYRWSPPNGYPDVAAAWASPSAFLMKCNLHLNLAAGWYPSQLTRPANLLKSLVPVPPATFGALVDALAVRLTGTRLPAAQTAAALSVAGKLPTSPVDKSLDGAAPYLIAMVLNSPTFQLR
ncbi:DUF1800 domain-containing protein [Actinoplanes sp. NPDC051343]|uniref:DUF1800 domain-containing protein n=1 Tax=Actinoplanes sp. NPDC051343 TaxID=3363906 RepID=UPI00378FF94C